MLGKRWALAVALLSLLAVPGLDADEADDRVVTYSYRGAGSVVGTVEGTCHAYGGFLPPDGSISFTAQGVTMTTAVIWINRTSSEAYDEPIVLPTPADYDRKEYVRPLDDGTYSVTGTGNATMAFRPSGHPTGEAATMEARFHAVDTHWPGVTEGTGVAGHYTGGDNAVGPQTMFNGLGYHYGRYPDGARGWEIRGGNLTLAGAATLHLREVRLEGPDVSFNQPAYSTELSNTSAPLDGAKVVTYRLEEAFIQLDRFSTLRAGPDMTLACGNTSAQVVGNMTVLQASGSASVAGEPVSFERQVLEVSGAFVLNEEARLEATGWRVHAEATGDVRAVGIDFEPALAAPHLPAVVVEVGLGLAATGFLLALTKKGLPALTVLFTRLRDAEVDAHPTRQRILEIIAPGPRTESFLVEALGVSRGSIRHHTEVLLRASMVRMIRMPSERFFGLPGQKVLDLRLYVVENDDRLSHVHKAFASGLARPKVAQYVANRLGVPSRSARRYVKQYENLLMQEGHAEGNR